MDPLGAAMCAELARASNAGVCRIFASLEAHFARGDWLERDNSYRAECIAQIKNDGRSGTYKDEQIGEYIAASVPLHSLDGWTFLARALSSYVRGNAHQAAHFAYYAELRAAMSILASQGVGVFNDRHFIIDDEGKCHALSTKRRTHEFVWLALNQWSTTATSGKALLDLFIVAGSTIREWLDAQVGSSIASSIAQDWLRGWGFDLQGVETDHDIRNLASYRPNKFSTWLINAKSSSQLLQSIWQLFEPENSRFELLDRQLLKQIVTRLMTSSGGDSQRWLNTMLDGLPLGGPVRRQLFDFLIAPDQDHVLLERLGTGLGPADPHIHERVIARAALLLRVSSGFTAQLIDQAPFAVPRLQFWTDSLGVDRGFWKPGDHPEDLVELWSDVLVAAEDERSWIDEHSTPTLSMFEWRSSREQVLNPLTECDRIGLWGLQR